MNRKLGFSLALMLVGAFVGGVLLVGGLVLAASGFAPRAGAGMPVNVAQVVAEQPVGSGAAMLQPTPSPLPPDVIAAADAEYLLLGNIYDRVSPSVVNIDVAVEFLEDEVPLEVASGSGFVYDMNGIIVTNSHVVRDADGLTITFRDGYVAEGELVGLDDFSDLAVVRVNVSPDHLMPVTLGGSDNLFVGQRVIAIGNPFGLASSMTVGVVSALGRTLPSAEMLDPNQQPFKNPAIIQVDAEINPGNSGGPLLDSNGAVIGVNTAIRTEDGVFQGVGFAVPVSTVYRVIPELIERGKVSYSWLGISSLSPEGGYSLAGLAEPLGLPVTAGVLVQTVEPNSPADRAGLLGGMNEGMVIRGQTLRVGGDIIVAVDGTFISTMDELVNYLVVNTHPGDEVLMTVIRDNQTLEVPVTLGSRPN